MSTLTKTGILWVIMNVLTFLLMILGSLSPCWLLSSDIKGLVKTNYYRNISISLLIQCIHIESKNI